MEVENEKKIGEKFENWGFRSESESERTPELLIKGASDLFYSSSATQNGTRLFCDPPPEIY
jgi:hypothetical protein